jgi:hypothetical protein
MFFLIQYARVVHAIRRYLSRTGTLSALDQRARNSRWWLWFRSVFSVLDFHDFVTLETPWWTLAAGRKVTDFLLRRPQARALEWGSGASTVWLGGLCASVTSIESDRHWAHMVRGSVPDHVQIVCPNVPRKRGHEAVSSKRWGFRSLDFSDYVGAAQELAGSFDIIVIDGRAREACFEVALDLLAPDGIILFDNTNRRRYRRALARHADRVCVERSIGLTPIVLWPTETSIVSLRNPSGHAAAASGDASVVTSER